MSAIKTCAKRAIGHLKRVWDDMDYAQRRLIELNFEVPLEASTASRSARAEIAQLEALYRLEARPPDLAERD
jgi:hypothetical protein